MLGERDVTNPPEPTGIRAPGHRRARTDSPPPGRRHRGETDRLIQPDPPPRDRSDAASIFSDSLRSIRQSMHDSWVRVSQGGNTTIHTYTPSRSDAQTVELEQL